MLGVRLERDPTWAETPATVHQDRDRLTTVADAWLVTRDTPLGHTAHWSSFGVVLPGLDRDHATSRRPGGPASWTRSDTAHYYQRELRALLEDGWTVTEG